MTRYLMVFFSFLIALGSLSELFFPGIVDIFTIIIAVLILFQSKYIKRLRKYSLEAFPLFFILIILLMAGLFYGYVETDIQGSSFKFLLAIFIYIIFSAFFCENPKFINISLLFFALGSAVLGILYFFNLLEGGLEIRNERLLFLGENPNSLSVRISLGILILVWLFFNSKISKAFFFVRYLLLIPLPFMLSLIIASGSKGSFILCVASIILLLLFSNSISKKAKYFSTIIIVVGFLFSYNIFLSSNLYSRFMNSSLTTGRSDLWKEAVDIFLDNPFGVGESGYFNEIKLRVGESIDTHNLFIYLLVTGGLFSFFLFSFFIFRLLKKAFVSLRLNKDPFFIIIWISMFFIMNKTGGVLSYLIMWYFLAIINAQNPMELSNKTQINNNN